LFIAVGFEKVIFLDLERILLKVNPFYLN